MSTIIYLDPPGNELIREVRWISAKGTMHSYSYEYKEPTKEELEYMIDRIIEAVHNGCSRDIIYDMLINPKYNN